MRLGLAVALIWGAAAALAEAPRVAPAGHLKFETVTPAEGGFSALTIDESGRSARILSDRGVLFDYWLDRDDAFALRGAVLTTMRALYIYEAEVRPDTEGMARAPDGGFYIAVEKQNLITHYEPGRSWPDFLPDLPDFRFQNINRGFEALAADDAGRVVIIPESVPKGEQGFPVLRLDDGAWTRIGTLPEEGGFMVVGADFGPDGKLYILERAVSLLGFRSRIRRLPVGGDGSETELVLQTRLGEFDNLEGIDVWRDPNGATRITLISDDNFLRVQRSELVEFILQE